MALFIYDREQIPQLEHVLSLVKKHRGVKHMSVNEAEFHTAGHAVINHNVVIVPTDIAHCTPIVERLRTIALQFKNKKVLNLAAYHAAREKENVPAAASAVPPTQQPAAVGQTIAAR